MATRRSKWLLLALACLAAIAASVFFWRPWRSPINTELEPERTFAGPSDLLQRTSVLPTLDSPIAENQTAIWCVSFQLAWNRLKNDVAKEPIKVTDAQDVADRLNAAPQTEDDVAANEVLAMSGKYEEDITGKIAAALAARFPGNTMPPIHERPDGGVVAFGYLKADVRYEYQFLNSPEWLSFKGSDGRNAPVRAFDLPELKKNDPVVGPSRSQVDVLFRAGGRFAIDLSHTSKPNQVILAKMPRKATLAATLEELNARLATPSPLPSSATLLVPNLNWRVEHRFREVENKDFLNRAIQDHFLARAFQFIDFKMDRFGSSVESGAYVAAALLNGDDHEEDTNPDHFHFDRPFLIVMKKRDATHPFFVMWVDNAELLSRRE